MQQLRPRQLSLATLSQNHDHDLHHAPRMREPLYSIAHTLGIHAVDVTQSLARNGGTPLGPGTDRGAGRKVGGEGQATD